jgi:DNA polymerase I-like protein with 3'-5' exonuclease and polymerase domains
MRDPIAVDCETTGLDAWRDKLLLTGMWDNGEKCWTSRSIDNSLSLLQTEMETRSIVGHNFKFDAKFIHNSLPPGTDPAFFRSFVSAWSDDTQLMAFVSTLKVPESYLAYYNKLRKETGKGHREGKRHSLKVLAPYFLGVEPFWEDPDDHDNDAYVLKDCEYTKRLFQFFAPKLEQQGSMKFYERLMGWNKMLLNIELRGISLNLKELDQVEKEYSEEEFKLREELDLLWKDAKEFYKEKEMYGLKKKYEEMTHKALEKLKDKAKTEHTIARYQKLFKEATSKIEEFNYDSPIQMAWLLKDYKNYDITNFEGEESTGKEVLNRLASQGHEDVKVYTNWRRTQKVLTMYVPPYKEKHYNGILHPSFNATGTRTGRLSSSDPNLQQVPSKLYRVFRPRDGYKILQYDLSGIEAALICLYTGDKALYDIIESGISIHNYNTKVFLGLDCPVEDVQKLFKNERDASKNVGFALFYNAGWKRVKHTFAAKGIMLTDKKAKELYNNFAEYYKTAREAVLGITDMFEGGEIMENLFGRPIKIQDWENAYMAGFNTLIQSSASDLNIRAAERATEAWNSRNIDCHILALIHDCILCEVKEEDAYIAEEILIHSMTDFNLECEHGKIKLRVEGGISDVWEK